MFELTLKSIYYSFIGVLSMIIVLSCVLLPLNTSASFPSYWEEDFDDLDLGTIDEQRGGWWQAAPGGGNVVNNLFRSSPQSLNGIGQSDFMPLPLFTSSGVDEYALSFYFSDNHDNPNGLWFYFDDIPNSTSTPSFKCTASGGVWNCHFNDSANSINVPIEKWIRAIEKIDTENNTCGITLLNEEQEVFFTDEVSLGAGFFNFSRIQVAGFGYNDYGWFYPVYIDDMKGYKPGVPDVPDFLTGRSSAITSLNLLWNEWTSPTHRIGINWAGYSLGDWTLLEETIKKDGAVYSTSTYQTALLTHLISHNETLSGLENASYEFDFQFCDDSQCSADVDKFYLELATSTTEKSEDVWLSINPIIPPSFLDKFGIGAKINNFLIEAKTKFPFSWFFGVNEIWKAQAIASENSDNPPVAAITLPAGSALGAVELTLVDFNSAKNQFSDFFAILRQIIIYILYISVVFVIFDMTKTFVLSLNKNKN